jgi:hypothetical protein
MIDSRLYTIFYLLAFLVALYGLVWLIREYRETGQMRATGEEWVKISRPLDK